MAVVDLGKRATRQRVHTRIEQLFGDEFTDADRKPRKGRHDEAAWRNNVDSAYDELKHRKEMEPSRRGDPWQLVPKTEAEARLYRDELADSLGGGFFDAFSPKSSDEYLSRVRGQLLVKRRDHEALVDQFGHAVALLGWRPATDVHPRDIELTRGTELCLVEVKWVSEGNVTAAVRESLAQLLEYSYFYYRCAVISPRLLAVFSEAVGDIYSQYLDQLNIASVWSDGKGGWRGSALAAAGQLVP